MLKGNEGESEERKSDRGLGREEERVFGRKMIENRGNGYSEREGRI